MATCPSCATELTAMPITGVGTNYVCTGCKQHYYAFGGSMFRAPYVTGGKATFTTSAVTIAVSHGLGVNPNDGDLMLTPANAPVVSGAKYYISATSSLNFVITQNMIQSGAAFFWRYNAI